MTVCSATDEDIDAYLTFVEREGYRHIILAGHSLGANKVIYYLSRHHDTRVEHFFLLSPANLTHMMSGVTEWEKRAIHEQVEQGDADRMLPFPFMGWVECIANTAWDWQFSGLLNNVHTAQDGDFSQAEKVTHTGALLVGTYDHFTAGDPAEFLKNINSHMPTAAQNELIFIEKTGHTYQGKNQEVADEILRQLQKWRSGRWSRRQASVLCHRICSAIRTRLCCCRASNTGTLPPRSGRCTVLVEKERETAYNGPMLCAVFRYCGAVNLIGIRQVRNDAASRSEVPNEQGVFI